MIERESANLVILQNIQKNNFCTIGDVPKIYVHVDIEMTAYLPLMDKRGHLADHLPTPFCPRGF